MASSCSSHPARWPSWAGSARWRFLGALAALFAAFGVLLIMAGAATLALAGHTHGGQICLPGERAIVTNADIDRKRASGLHRYGDMWMEVSNGLGQSKYAPVRLFCPPSATLIEVAARES